MHKTLVLSLAALIAGGSLAIPLPANATPHRDTRHMTMRRGSWVRGRHISATDRHRAIPVDYRHHGLKAPPHGFRWIRINGSYLMIGLNSGMISAVVPVR